MSKQKGDIISQSQEEEFEWDRFCQNCKYVDPKEDDQTREHEPHMCTYFNVRIYHRRYHPNLVRTFQCTDIEKDTNIFSSN